MELEAAQEESDGRSSRCCRETSTCCCRIRPGLQNLGAENENCEFTQVRTGCSVLVANIRYLYTPFQLKTILSPNSDLSPEFGVHAIRCATTRRRDHDITTDVRIVVVQAFIGALCWRDTGSLVQEGGVAVLARALVAAECAVGKDLIIRERKRLRCASGIIRLEWPHAIICLARSNVAGDAWVVASKTLRVSGRCGRLY